MTDKLKEEQLEKMKSLIDSIANNVFEILDHHGLLLELDSKGKVDRSEAIIKKARTDIELMKKHRNLLKSENYHNYIKSMKEFGFEEDEVKRTSYLLTIFSILEVFEAFKLWFLTILDKSKKVENMQFKEGDTFGKFWDKLSKILRYPDFFNLINNSIRTSIAILILSQTCNQLLSLCFF